MVKALTRSIEQRVGAGLVAVPVPPAAHGSSAAGTSAASLSLGAMVSSVSVWAGLDACPLELLGKTRADLHEAYVTSVHAPCLLLRHVG